MGYFWCKGFVVDKFTGTRKLLVREHKCVCLNYSRESEGYTVWLIDDSKLDRIRDIEFMAPFVFLTEQKYKGFNSAENLEKKPAEEITGCK